MKTRTKVAVLGSRGYPSYYGGFETAVRKIVESKGTQDFDFIVYSRKENCLEDPCRKNVSVIYTNFIKSESFATLSHVFFAFNSIRREKPDVVLAFNVTCGFVAPLFRILGIPVLLNVDGLEWKRRKWGPIGKSVFYTAAWASALFANVLISDSTNISHYWKKHFRRDSYFIPYGGDIAETNSEKTNTKPYVLYVARFVPENHISEFLDSVKFIDSTVDIYVVGSSHSEEFASDKLKQLSNTHLRVKDLGRVQDDRRLHELWANSSIYFHGHSVGGTNPALVQAMASGCSIVAFDSIFNREVLADCALYVSADPSDIATKINYLLDNSALRSALSQSAKKRAAEEYDWDKIVNKYGNLIKGLSK